MQQNSFFLLSVPVDFPSAMQAIPAELPRAAKFGRQLRPDEFQSDVQSRLGTAFGMGSPHGLALLVG